MKYDIAIIGSGPGGYVAAEKASQLGYKVALIEKERLGGICLNWGCIPTKALLKSAQAYHYAVKSEDYGVKISGEIKADFNKMVERSRNVADMMNKGVEFLMKKNNVDVIFGKGTLTKEKTIEVESEAGKQTVEADKIILACGAHSRVLPNLPQDGKHIIGYREAMTLDYQPESMLVVGSGAIGSEFAHFYQSIGTQVTLVEFMPTIVPNEDKEVASTLQRVFKKNGMKVYTSTSVDSVNVVDNKCVVTLSGKKTETVECDVVLSAVGVETNLAGLGLENIGIEPVKGKVPVNEWYETSVEGIYAIGDIVGGPALAHVASKEAEVCVKHIKGLEVKPISYNNIPGCTYTTPEIASVGLSEDKAKEQGYNTKTGKFMFMASGKATAAGNRDGFVKVVLNADDNKILGCSMIGDNVTEMIEEIVVARENSLNAQDLIDSVHPHPTMSEAVAEALNSALNS
ncbi:MAG: dihydrolipoyl dehydrogenase [Bacteroidales bacterium]|nr:dihydrolipoyl dehydrogenase [Bacteroidales bacterium]